MSQIGLICLVIIHMSYNELFFSNIILIVLSNLALVHLKFLYSRFIFMLRKVEGGTKDNIIESHHYSWMLTATEFQILLQRGILLFMVNKPHGIYFLKFQSYYVSLLIGVFFSSSGTTLLDM